MKLHDLGPFNAWSREEAADIRNYAAAFGETAEYAYLKKQEVLRSRMRKKFPDLTEALLDSVEHDCYDSSIPLDLVQINKHRAEFEFPPLGFIPPLRLKEEYRPPMPGDVPECPPPPGPSFYDWAIDKLILIRHGAVASGVDVERAFLERQWALINTNNRNFPDVGAANGLRLMRHWVHDKAVTEAPLDQERIRGLRAWNGTVKEVVDSVEALSRGEDLPTNPPLKS